MQRQPHAALDLTGRWPKAQKIERLLTSAAPDLRFHKPALLEIGTGSGAIAHYFARRAAVICDVHAVDVVDQRQVSDGYGYTNVDGVLLPFEDGQFDFVVSNHVIEHVGGADEQRRHLAEVRRVLKPSGVVYLAVPNRWQVLEPHFKLPFLSWLPVRWRDSYVRIARRGERYDCAPLTCGDLEGMLRASGFAFENAGFRAMRETLAIEYADSALALMLARMPLAALRPFESLLPTLVYLLRHVNGSVADRGAWR